MQISANLTQQCSQAVADTVNSGKWSSHLDGSCVQRLEKEIAAHYGVPYAIAATPPFLLEEYARDLGEVFDLTDQPVLPRGKTGLLDLERIFDRPVNIGVALTRNKHKYEMLWSRVNCGRKPGRPWYEHHRLGSNARPSEFVGTLMLMLWKETMKGAG